MFCEIHLLYISRSTEIYRRNVLFYLCVIACFVQLVAEEHYSNLIKPYQEDYNSECTCQHLAAALFSEFCSLLLKCIFLYIKFFCFHIVFYLKLKLFQQCLKFSCKFQHRKIIHAVVVMCCHIVVLCLTHTHFVLKYFCH